MDVLIYPIYGIVFGCSYWNSDMDNLESLDGTKEHAIQLTIGIIGVNFTVWTRED